MLLTNIQMSRLMEYDNVMHSNCSYVCESSYMNTNKNTRTEHSVEKYKLIRLTNIVDGQFSKTLKEVRFLKKRVRDVLIFK